MEREGKKCRGGKAKRKPPRAKAARCLGSVRLLAVNGWRRRRRKTRVPSISDSNINKSAEEEEEEEEEGDVFFAGGKKGGPRDIAAAERKEEN